jgi:DNA-binding CsgD family transcriptional regulator
MAPGLARDETRRAGVVLEAAERSSSLAELMSVTLESLDEHLGFRQGAFMLTVAEPPLPGFRAYAALQHGFAPAVLEEYFERWANVDAFASDASQRSFVSRGWASIPDLYRQLDSPQQRYVDDFLRPARQESQFSIRLPGGWTDGYLTMVARSDDAERDRLELGALVERLSELLRERLPARFDGALSAREAQVAELVALGFSNREIAEVLNVEEDTVKKHVSRAMKRLGMDRRTQLAVAWATGRRLDVPAVNGSA